MNGIDESRREKMPLLTAFCTRNIIRSTLWIIYERNWKTFSSKITLTTNDQTTMAKYIKTLKKVMNRVKQPIANRLIEINLYLFQQSCEMHMWQLLFLLLITDKTQKTLDAIFFLNYCTISIFLFVLIAHNC